MKKIYILATVALVASAACTKIETAETPETGSKIAFEVANYMSTKAAGDPKTALQAEGFTSFNTYANFFPKTGDPQAYMDNVVVSADNPTTPTVWAPARDYYWPKTGWINFYSYASTHNKVPAITFNGDKTVATAAYTNMTIAADDNFLLADAALKQNQNLTEYTSISGVTSGVPTLFRHQLARVNFDIKLATTDAKMSATTKFVVTVLNTGTTLSNLKANNTGSLSLTNTVDAATGAHTLAWSDVKVWTPAAGVETMGFNTVTMTLPKDTKDIAAVSLLDERTVMPQTLDDDNVFTLTYQVETFYGDEATPYMTEIITVTDKLATLVNSITAWNKNTKITYHIVIDPVGNKVTFDPAVEEWGTAEGTYSYPTA
ncbi:MAG: hypothetical protein IJU34_04385 [Bacteroidales bacterium]|nr:hypothetical protein [Bacteroidales bacterium]